MDLTKILAITSFGLFSYAPDQASDIAAQCVAIYAGAVTRTVESRQRDVALATLHDTACSSSNRSLSGGFDSSSKALIDGVPMLNQTLGNMNISSNDAFCRAYDSGQFHLSEAESYLREPVVEAMEQANHCMDIANRENLVLTHTVTGPGAVSFAGHFTRTEQLARISAQTTGGFACDSPRPGGGNADAVAQAEIRRNVDFSVRCNRPGVPHDGDTDYPEGAITLFTNQGGLYTVHVRPDSTFGIATRRDYEARLAEMQSNGNRLRNENNRLRAPRSRVVHWYFSDERIPNSALRRNADNEHFDCNDWQNHSDEQRMEMVRNRLCPGGRLIPETFEHSDSGGNRCGVNWYTASCETLPN